MISCSATTNGGATGSARLTDGSILTGGALGSWEASGGLVILSPDNASCRAVASTLSCTHTT